MPAGAHDSAPPPPGAPDAPSPALRRNVPLLGFTALLNDTAAEMAYWVLPFFLTVTLGAGPEALGVIEGIAESLASLLRVISGHLTDRYRRRKPLVVFGYLLANAAKPLLGFTRTWGQVLALRAIDRGGKGTRGAPRDVMIAESVAAERLGAAYGLRQALDSAGAILGPALAYWIMWRSSQDARLVFWLAAIPGGLTVALAWGWLRETGAGARPLAPRFSRSDPQFKAKSPPFTLAFYVLLAAVALFGLANFSDMFLILRAQSLGVPPAEAPLLGLVFNVVFATLSFPLGRLSDRWRRQWLVAAGYFVFAAVHLGFASIRGAGMVWALFAFYGLYQALSTGVLSALVADLVAPEARGRAFGWVAAVAGVAALLASLLAGWLWQHHGAATAFELASALAACAGLLILTVPSSRFRPSPSLPGI